MKGEGLSSQTLWQFAEPCVDNGHGDELRECLRYATVAHAFVKSSRPGGLATARQYLDRAKTYTRFTKGGAGIDEVDDYLGAVEADLITREQLGK